MGKLANNGFDPKAFLAKIGAGKTILKFEKNQRVFEQGEVADTVFYIQKGSVKLTVLSEQGKEAVVGIIEPGHFFGEGCPVMESTRADKRKSSALSEYFALLTHIDRSPFHI